MLALVGLKFAEVASTLLPKPMLGAPEPRVCHFSETVPVRTPFARVGFQFHDDVTVLYAGFSTTTVYGVFTTVLLDSVICRVFPYAPPLIGHALFSETLTSQAPPPCTPGTIFKGFTINQKPSHTDILARMSLLK